MYMIEKRCHRQQDNQKGYNMENNYITLLGQKESLQSKRDELTREVIRIDRLIKQIEVELETYQNE